MREPDERDPIDIWLAYSDLFSGVFVLVFGLLLFQLFPMGVGEGYENQELLRRNQAQWDLTKNLFEEVKKSGYMPFPGNLAEARERFDDKAGKFPDVVTFKDGKGKDAVVIYRPQGEEQRITFGENALFENNGEFLKKIKPEGLSLLQKIGSSILIAGSLDNGEIRVFGHSDVKPMQSDDPIKANWVLSSERAIALVTVLLTDETIGKRLLEQWGEDRRVSYRQYKSDGEIKLNAPPNRVSAIGRGEFEPIGSVIGESWDDRKAKIYLSSNDEKSMTSNRRIELIIKFISVPEQ